MSLKKLAIYGAIWTILGFGASQIIRFGNNLILTRLLQPEYFGFMAVVNTLLIGLELFSDVGIGQSIIQNKRGDDPIFLNTAWTVQIIRSIILWLFCVLLSWPAANFYEDERLVLVLPIAGFGVIFSGLSSTSVATLNRKMDLRKCILFELVISLIAVIVQLVIAWYTRSLWSLVIGNLTAGILRMVGSHLLIPGWRNRLAWDREALSEILSFGKWMFVASGIMFLAEQADRLILGKLLSLKILGIYSVAYTLASMPREIIKSLSYRVIFPTISNRADLPRTTLRAKILKPRRLILMGVAVVLAFLVSVGDYIVILLYDQRYIEASWMMPILSCGIWFSVLFYTANPALLAIGKPMYSAQSNLFRFLMIGIGLPIGYYLSGTLGAIIIVALSDVPLYIVNLYGLWREGLLCLAQDMQMTILFVGLLCSLLMIRSALGFGLPVNAIL
jgi:O-antigen/teichoic acid export membrane protein